MSILSTKPDPRSSVVRPARTRSISLLGPAIGLLLGAGLVVLVLSQLNWQAVLDMADGVLSLGPSQAVLNCLNPSGEPETIEEICNQALAEEDLEPVVRGSALAIRGEARSNLDRSDEAIRDFTEAIELRPNWAPAYFGRGVARLRNSEFTLSIWDLEQAEAFDSSLASLARLKRGVAYYFLGKSEKAEKELGLALEDRPDDPEALTFRGLALLARFAYPKAMSDFDKAIAIAPNSYAFFGRAQARALAGNAEGALTDAERAIDRDREVPQFHWVRCRALALLDRGEDALEACKEGLAFDSDDPNLLFARAFAHWLTGDDAGAIEDLSRLPRRMQEETYTRQAQNFRRRLLASFLHRAGFDPGPVDGVARKRLRRAIEKFQAAQGLPVDGEANDALLKQLRKAVG